MTTINADVTPGHEYKPDANGVIRLTPTTLDRLGAPTVTLDLIGAVDTEDLVDDSVTVAKLDSVVQNLMLQVSPVVGDEGGSDDVQVVLQVKDAAGNNYAGQVFLDVWLAGNDYGWPIWVPSTAAPVVDTGYEIETPSASAVGRYLTNTSGLLELTYTHTGADSKHFVCVIQGRKVNGDQQLSWT